MTQSANLRGAVKILVAASVFASCFSLPSRAHDLITTKITFSREISRLFYSRCASCHHPGGPAFSLLTFQDARPWATAIKEETLERRMPPWGAVRGFGEFMGDQALTQEQLELIAEWVEGGAPEGDPALLPPVPDFQKTPPAAPAATEIALDGFMRLKAPLTLAGIRPKHVGDGASLMVIAERPDGSIQPLLWLYNFRNRFAHAYFYANGLRLEPGTRIEVSPPEAGTVALLLGRRK